MPSTTAARLCQNWRIEKSRGSTTRAPSGGHAIPGRVENLPDLLHQFNRCERLRQERHRVAAETLYHRLVQARTDTGEKSGVPSLKDFEKFVQKKTKDLKDKGGREIEYTVSIENGHVKLKARVSA